jgi:hypothetical protein
VTRKRFNAAASLFEGTPHRFADVTLVIRFTFQDANVGTKPDTTIQSHLIPLKTIAIRLTSACLRRPTLLFRADVSFAPARRRHIRYVHTDITKARRIRAHGLHGLPVKTARKKCASLITYPHSVTKHFQNDPTRPSALRFLKIF